MATDFVHTAELVDAVVAVLHGEGDDHAGGLPVAWFTRGDKEKLKLLQADDLADYGGELLDELPAIIVRGLGIVGEPNRSVGGVVNTEELIRVLHLRRFEECYTATGDHEKTPGKARCRYAKIIGKALFNDSHAKLAVIAADGTRTEVSLTCSDGAGAQLWDVGFGGWDLGYALGNPNSTEDVAVIRDMNAQVMAIACDLRVRVRSGGNA